MKNTPKYIKQVAKNWRSNIELFQCPEAKNIYELGKDEVIWVGDEKDLHKYKIVDWDIFNNIQMKMHLKEFDKYETEDDFHEVLVVLVK